MTRHMSATTGGGLSTFLLEMALDKRRMKARLSSVLLEERTRRGRDYKALPQPEMAAFLGYSLRQYQRLEDENDPSIPIWEDLSRLLEKLDRDATELFDDPPEPDTAEHDAATDPLAAEAGDIRDLRVLVDALLRQEGLDPDQILRDSRLVPGEPERDVEGLEPPAAAESAA